MRNGVETRSSFYFSVITFLSIKELCNLHLNLFSPIGILSIGIRAAFLMAQKKMDNRMDLLENEMEEVKVGIQRLPELEKSVEHLAQSVVKMLQSNPWRKPKGQ